MPKPERDLAIVHHDGSRDFTRNKDTTEAIGFLAPRGVEIQGLKTSDANRFTMLFCDLRALPAHNEVLVSRDVARSDCVEPEPSILWTLIQNTCEVISGLIEVGNYRNRGDSEDFRDRIRNDRLRGRRRGRFS